MLLCLGELPVRFLWCWLLLFIHFCSSFCCCCSSFILFFILLLLFFISLLLIWWCTSHCFSTSSLTLPWTIAGFLHPFYTFSPVHCRVICEPFIFNLFEIFFSQFYRERYGFVWAFFTHRRFFTLRSFTDILPAFIKASLGAGSSSLEFGEFHTDPRNTDPAHRFFDSQSSAIFIFRTIHF